MSHAIEQDAATGTAAFFSARETPWHKLGQLTTECLTAEEAIATAHLDWQVTKEPLSTTVVSEAGVSTIEIPDKFATVRVNPFTGKPEVLGVVGSQYTPVQNIDNAEFLNAIVEESGAHFETAGSLWNGRQVFITMKAPKGLLIGGHDAVDQYLVATNSHDGSTAFRVAVTPTRVVCANTLRAGLQNAKSTFSTRHTVNAKGRIDEARRALGVMWNYMEEFEAVANHLYDAEFTNAEFDRLVAHLVPETKDAAPRTVTMRAEKIGKITDLYRTAATQEGIRGTKWGAYNALTEYADWFLPVRGDETARCERIAAGGATDEFKQLALMALV